ELTEEGEPVAVDRPAAMVSQIASVPTVSQDRPQGVFPEAKHPGHVVGLVLKAPLITGPARRHLPVADPPPVEMHPVDAEARHVKAGRAHLAVHLEAPAQERTGSGRLWIFIPAGRDPIGLPVVARDHPRLEEGRLAPWRG